MLKNFHLAAIVKQRLQMRVLRIPLNQSLENSLAESWQTQYESFVEGIDEVNFDPGYTLNTHERFYLSEFKLPDPLANENSLTARTLDSIGDDDALIDSIKGIVAFARTSHRQELILFQYFKPSQVIRSGWSLILHRGMYNSLERPGLTLSRKLSAIYRPEERKLIFDNFRNVNTFLPLSDFYKEASEQDIREILTHDRLAPEDSDEIATNPDLWTRKRFSMLRDSGILDKFSTNEILERSQGYDISIQIEGDKIVFPAEKQRAKRLLQFFNEEVFRGPLTDTLYETNSKRKAD